MDNLISVIIPIYNTEPYISDCVHSVLKQTYTCFEIILIDDGSEDGSLEVCKELRTEDERIYLLEQEHKGVSAARNLGIKISQGKYLFFLDSDDIIHPQLLEMLYNYLEKYHAVIATGGYRLTNTKELQTLYMQDIQNIVSEIKESKECQYLDNKKSLEYFPIETPDYKLFAIGGKMVLRESVKGIKFNSKLANAEDVLFIYQLFFGGADTVILYHRWYYHRMHEKNACRRRSIPAYQDQYEVAKYIRDREKIFGRTTNAINWEVFIIKHIFGWYYVCQQNSGADSNLKDYLRKIMYIEGRENLFSKFEIDIKIKFYIALHCFPLYCKLYYFFWEKKQCNIMDIFTDKYKV